MWHLYTLQLKEDYSAPIIMLNTKYSVKNPPPAIGRSPQVGHVVWHVSSVPAHVTGLKDYRIRTWTSSGVTILFMEGCTSRSIPNALHGITPCEGCILLVSRAFFMHIYAQLNGSQSQTSRARGMYQLGWSVSRSFHTPPVGKITPLFEILKLRAGS